MRHCILRYRIRSPFFIFIFLSLLTDTLFPQSIIIDHTCTNISHIPEVWINTVKSTMQIHYAHTSHGGQIIVGLEALQSENAIYAFETGSSSLPQIPNVVCIFDGQESDTYIGPETPNPLMVTILRSKHRQPEMRTVLSDIMGLTKINYNSCNFNDGLPVTVRFAKMVGDILVMGSARDGGPQPFKFYI